MNKFQVPGRVRQVNATILAPQNAGLRFVLNLVGQDGKYDKELDKLLSSKYANIRTDYKEWFATQNNFKIGSLRTVATASDTWVIHMLCKDKNGNTTKEALSLGVKSLVKLAVYEKASVHVSTMLTKEIEGLSDLLIEQVAGNGVNLYFYEEPEKLR